MVFTFFSDGHQALTKFCKLYVCSLCKCFAEDDKLNLIQHFKTQHSNMMAYPPALPDPVSGKKIIFCWFVKLDLKDLNLINFTVETCARR
jgi:hypothetical protein